MRQTLIFTTMILAVSHSVASPGPVLTPLDEPATQMMRCPACPQLVVWTSRTCLPCRTFWHDMSEDVAFREALTSRFCVKWIDADIHSHAASRAGINALPTFVLDDRRITGYEGKQSLWDQLTRSDADRWQPVVSPEIEQDLVSPAALPNLERPPRPEPLNSLTDDVRQVIDQATSESLTITSPVDDKRQIESTIADRTQTPKHSPRPSLWTRLRGAITRTAPLALTALELAGLLSGTAATGGLGTLAVAVLWKVWARRRLRSRSIRDQSGTTDIDTEEGKSRGQPRAPFPRELDEARELLALRQSEGRVAVLDALRGMFLDDELTKLKTTGNDTEAAVVRQLQTNIDTRVDEVAPLSTTFAGA